MTVDSRQWMVDAACRGLDPTHWFPEEGVGTLRRRDTYKSAEARLAQRICRNCPVVMECKAYARETDSLYGIWGATTPADRQAEDGRGRRSS